ncbi:uncharacterized protein LOC126906927 isoform X2 [Daktulosphaira vitifoliae]|uniref:uncharacterized protein LOC126906927 isoform X2 n=1 Tax=Daktulosphaira vitifoliae TaxID=58002 RepID=UPI0021A9AAFE|nr:uncharacterized protein LOC126906927 isoform X2 [Daktulosphaira vitifoliae]XP_050543832.1 uncharacterized protein LOC126906927 isoform X2 [Daktulosphaira vitifoliae]XP_050543834.1 uncharacterized protein LOC126906927 isoform X2 [Daktulosphaira vitifoliae]
MNVHEGDLNEDDRNEVRKCIVGDIIKIISGKIPLDGVVRGIKFFIFGSVEIPFAEYCCAAFYTYLVLDDSMFSGLILPTSAGIKLNKVINYLSSKNLSHGQNAFHNCIANLNINGFEQMNYEEFNQSLSRLGDDIISREIQPKEMSPKIYHKHNLHSIIALLI